MDNQISQLRERIQDEFRIRGRREKVRNIVFLCRGEDGIKVWIIYGNNGKILGYAKESEELEVIGSGF